MDKNLWRWWDNLTSTWAFRASSLASNNSEEKALWNKAIWCSHFTGTTGVCFDRLHENTIWPVLLVMLLPKRYMSLFEDWLQLWFFRTFVFARRNFSRKEKSLTCHLTSRHVLSETWEDFYQAEWRVKRTHSVRRELFLWEAKDPRTTLFYVHLCSKK